MKLVFTGKRRDHGRVYSFDFKPAEPIKWTAGQSIRLEVPVDYDVQEKRFTISSAPFENKITITTRVSDSKFKQSLDSLTPGETIDAQAIEGDFVWLETDQPKVFCAQGIGITPFFSILKQLEYEKVSPKIKLIYASRSQDFVFRTELESMSVKWPGFEIVFLPGQALSAETISSQLNDQLVYLSGPEEIINKLSAELPPGNLKTDLFTGRADWDK